MRGTAFNLLLCVVLLRWISDGIFDDTFVCRLVSGTQRPWTVAVSPLELRCSCISMVLAWVGLVTGGWRLGVWPLEGYRGVETSCSSEVMDAVTVARIGNPQ